MADNGPDTTGRRFQFAAEPLAELLVIGQGFPNAMTGRLQLDMPLDAVFVHMQLLDCISAPRARNDDFLAAYFCRLRPGPRASIA